MGPPSGGPRCLGPAQKRLKKNVLWSWNQVPSQLESAINEPATLGIYNSYIMIMVRALTQYLSKCRVSFGIFHHVEACTNNIYIYQQYQWISHLSFVPISTIDIAFWSEVRGPPTCRGGRGKPFRWGPQPKSTSQKHPHFFSKTCR